MSSKQIYVTALVEMVRQYSLTYNRPIQRASTIKMNGIVEIGTIVITATMKLE